MMDGSNSGNSSITPLHQRKYTPHSYFSNTLRHVVASSTTSSTSVSNVTPSESLDQSITVLIPQPNTEMHLRKVMFKVYKDASIRTLREYEVHLRELLDRETVHVDVELSERVRKRYLYLKADIQAGTVHPERDLPLDATAIARLHAMRKEVVVEVPGKVSASSTGATTTTLVA